MAEIIILILLLLAVITAAIILFRPKSKWHDIPLSKIGDHKPIAAIAMVLVILCCIIPMNLSPVWNGEIPKHRNQYEKLTESFLKGHLYLDEEVDEKLLALENPYDPDLRKQEGVGFLQDHALYNGKYYVYFGVVPVLLTFLPYRVITGLPLNSYHATQLYTALFILGYFYCFCLFGKKWFKQISIGMYIMLSSALSVMCVWNAVSTPAMYCTANTAGMALMIWGIALCVKAVWFCKSEKQSVALMTLGTFFGALVFGCRPPVGLGNALILLLLWYYIRNHKEQKLIILKILLFLIPYAVVGSLLMWYNYVRFDSFFEFGQTYQLTLIDVKNAPGIMNAASLKALIVTVSNTFVTMAKYLFNIGGIKNFTEIGTFFAFPILFYILIGLENEKERALIRKHQIKGIFILLFIIAIAILFLDAAGSPLFYSRYRMDTYWVFGIMAYLAIGLYHNVKENKRRFSSFICAFSIFTVLVCVLLFIYPYDLNFTGYYMENIMGLIS